MRPYTCARSSQSMFFLLTCLFLAICKLNQWWYYFPVSSFIICCRWRHWIFYICLLEIFFWVFPENAYGISSFPINSFTSVFADLRVEQQMLFFLSLSITVWSVSFTFSLRPTFFGSYFGLTDLYNSVQSLDMLSLVFGYAVFGLWLCWLIRSAFSYSGFYQMESLLNFSALRMALHSKLGLHFWRNRSSLLNFHYSSSL